jgi:hypothetical protein
MSILQDIIVFVFGLISFIYLLNPTAGFIELIPDNIPIIGNLDEAGATAVVLFSLRYYGVDLLNLFRNFSQREGSYRRSQ